MATLTYVYVDRAAVLGPLATTHVPGAFDLCTDHAQRTTVPRGWEVIRLPIDQRRSQPFVDTDDLLALADAVREIGLRHDEPEPTPLEVREPEPVRRAGHLRLLRSVD